MNCPCEKRNHLKCKQAFKLWKDFDNKLKLYGFDSIEAINAKKLYFNHIEFFYMFYCVVFHVV